MSILYHKTKSPTQCRAWGGDCLDYLIFEGPATKASANQSGSKPSSRIIAEMPQRGKTARIISDGLCSSPAVYILTKNFPERKLFVG